MARTFTEKIARARGILFDLDNTLYPREKGVFDRVNERIDRFVSVLTTLPPPGVKDLRRDYVQRYGTTLCGLMENHGVQPSEFLEFVHDVPLTDLLSPDEALRDFLSRIDLPKVIFTNASSSHAVRVLDALVVGDQFDGICALEAVGYRGKPHREAYRMAADLLNASADDTLFIDDLDVNVRVGSSLGMKTVYVGAEPLEEADLVVSRVVDIAEHLTGVEWFRG